MKGVTDQGGFVIEPVQTEHTNDVVPKGYAGYMDLPLIHTETGTMMAFVPSREALEAMLEKPFVIQLFMAEDATISMTAMPVQLVKKEFDA